MAEPDSRPPGASASLNSPPTTPPQPDEQPYQPNDLQQAPNAAEPIRYTDIPYSQSFTDTLMTHILSQPAPPPQDHRSTSRKAKPASTRSHDTHDPTALHILPPTPTDPPATATATTSMRSTRNTIALSAIDPTTLPAIQATELPLPLDDPRRIYASSIPGVRLTHPGGWLEGGAGSGTPGLLNASEAPTTRGATPDGGGGATDSRAEAAGQPALEVFAEAFIRENNVGSAGALRAVVAQASGAQIEELRRRMGERQDAGRRNERVRREIDELVEERKMERRVHEQLMKMRREKMGGAEGGG